ncbi:RES family NAD+ phosphorylase [Pedobacter endophyticus]|uniref:RES family NAD+ phosphorylase n=1 Tax=Pedobacter endophyticus TaxID=2789740 RepID=A0A7S9Q0J8_9SPHI|nr:RES family NAD+ phosphorylase [Pedobacter endophyticus]QPH40762.1 RES family NAD+ phosphorylase [Pedobacter endophyticus]
MRVYRLSKSKYKNDLEGIGAKMAGGRWNKVGVACVYTSESRSLAILEYAANVDFDAMPRDLHNIEYEIPEQDFLTFEETQFPENWKEMPGPQSTKDFGSSYLNNRDVLGITVPSTIVPNEYNYLINPNSSKLAQIEIVQAITFVFDLRIKG